MPLPLHDMVETFSCSSTRHCMYDACCKICSSIDINILDNMEIIESPNEDSTSGDDDYHDDQFDQPKMWVRFYELGKSDERKITNISWNLWICLLPMQLNCSSNKLLCWIECNQASAYHEVKDNLKLIWTRL